jgi:carbon monoxide dehydrogenase subunit G
VNGRVTAEPATGNEIELVAEKSGRRQDPKTVEIEFAEHDGGLTVCAVYPSADPSRKNECKPGRQGRIGARNNDVVVDFKLKVPAGVGFVARTVNGRVEVLRLSGNVEAYTVNGSVHLAADGYAQAETVNGSIQAELGKADWKDAVAFKTVNGSVNVALPPTANTLLRVETVNGSIEADFAMNGAVKKTRRELSGTIGNGGRELRVNTVNGSVHLRKAAS